MGQGTGHHEEPHKIEVKEFEKELKETSRELRDNENTFAHRLSEVTKDVVKVLTDLNNDKALELDSPLDLAMLGKREIPYESISDDSDSALLASLRDALSTRLRFAVGAKPDAQAFRSRTRARFVSRVLGVANEGNADLAQTADNLLERLRLCLSDPEWEAKSETDKLVARIADEWKKLDDSAFWISMEAATRVPSELQLTSYEHLAWLGIVTELGVHLDGGASVVWDSADEKADLVTHMREAIRDEYGNVEDVADLYALAAKLVRSNQERLPRAVVAELLRLALVEPERPKKLSLDTLLKTPDPQPDTSSMSPQDAARALAGYEQRDELRSLALTLRDCATKRSEHAARVITMTREERESAFEGRLRERWEADCTGVLDSLDNKARAKLATFLKASELLSKLDKWDERIRNGKRSVDDNLSTLAKLVAAELARFKQALAQTYGTDANTSEVMLEALSERLGIAISSQIGNVLAGEPARRRPRSSGVRFELAEQERSTAELRMARAKTQGNRTTEYLEYTVAQLKKDFNLDLSNSTPFTRIASLVTSIESVKDANNMDGEQLSIWLIALRGEFASARAIDAGRADAAMRAYVRALDAYAQGLAERYSSSIDAAILDGPFRVRAEIELLRNQAEKPVPTLKELQSLWGPSKDALLSELEGPQRKVLNALLNRELQKKLKSWAELASSSKPNLDKLIASAWEIANILRYYNSQLTAFFKTIGGPQAGTIKAGFQDLIEDVAAGVSAHLSEIDLG